mmetsp:Transcript_54053/g.129214  ORF Transcript_54053/g.129214 Transcript_54053/m.129214 type:complete len:263 (-) Transcript_54053:7-795(-)
MRLTLTHVVRLGVVDGMGPLPREVRYHERGVQRIADQRLQPLLVAERVVAALVSDDPRSSGDGALRHRIEDPQGDGSCGHRDVLPGQIATQQHLEGGGRRVRQGSAGLLDQAILWDGAQDLALGGPLLVLLQGDAVKAAALQGLLHTVLQDGLTFHIPAQGLGRALQSAHCLSALAAPNPPPEAPRDRHSSCSESREGTFARRLLAACLAAWQRASGRLSAQVALQRVAFQAHLRLYLAYGKCQIHRLFLPKGGASVMALKT